MTDVVVPPLSTASDEERLKVLAYTVEHGLKPAARLHSRRTEDKTQWEGLSVTDKRGMWCACVE